MSSLLNPYWYGAAGGASFYEILNSQKLSSPADTMSVTFTAKELVDICNKKIKELNIKNVYVSTDCTNKEDLEYIANSL